MKYTKKQNYTIKQTYNNKQSYSNKQTYSNKHILKILTLVKDYYKEKNDKIRVNSYEKALYQISKWNIPIKKGSELAHLDGIGKGMIEKIDTILSSGTLPILDDIHLNTKINKEVNTILNNTVLNNKSLMTNKSFKNTKLNTILGFGTAFVNELINKHNARTIQDVKHLVHTNKIKLTHIQELGLKYYKDLQSFIPRDEITYLTNQLKKIINNTNYTMLVSGSYPSNTKKKSKDIDILIVKHSNNKETNNIHSGDLYKLINKIKNKIEDINKDEDINKENNLESVSLGDRKFMGLIKSPISHKMRHLDIRLVTIEELPYTWIYYSSGRMFNKIIRQKLKQKGYKLNEYGLYKDNKKVNIDEKTKVNMSIDNIMYNSMDNTINKKEKKLLDYIKNIEKKVFHIATMDYQTVQERY